MKNFVKTLALALIMMCSFTAVQAQEKGQSVAGVNFGWGVGGHDFNHVGLGMKYAYGLTDNLRLELGGMYYFEHKTYDFFDLNLNAHYLFNVAEKTYVYPIFGFSGLFGTEHKVDDNDTFARFGVNLGAGGQYNITDDFGVTLEAKYKIAKDFGHFGLALGCVVLF